MLNEFINFIKSDPIMLGLSCAIVFLVFVFILVLLFGGKKKTKEVEDNAIDNTSALLKTDLETEPLKSTQEFILNLNMANNKEEPIVHEETPSIAVEAENPTPVEPVLPIAEEAIPVPVETNGSVPVMDETANFEPLQTQDVSITATVALPEIKAAQEESNEMSNPVVENNTVVEPKEEEVIPDEPMDDIELPMLNTNKDTSVLSTLEGEHYDI